jgi:hypothetical protein
MTPVRQSIKKRIETVPADQSLGPFLSKISPEPKRLSTHHEEVHGSEDSDLK